MIDPRQDEIDRLARELQFEAEEKKRSPKQKKTNVLPFAGAAAEEEEKPSYAEILLLLEAMDDVEYDRCRRAKAGEWGLQLATLDKLRKHAKLRQEYAQQTQQPKPEPDELKHRLAYIWETEGHPRSVAAILGSGDGGRAWQCEIAVLDRHFPAVRQAMHAAIKGPSSGGKSEIRRQVLEFFPPEDIVSFTTMSDRALLYHQGDFDHKVLSMAEAHSFQERDMQDYLLRELMSEGKLKYPVVQKVGGQLVTRVIIKNGPVAFLVTTTRAALNPENETRMISLEIDDSENQTRRVLNKLAQTDGKNLRPDDSIHWDWQDYQRLLREIGNRNVVVPFADALASLIPPRATRLRRDFMQIIICIKSHALIHCCKRMNNERGELVADLDLDYVPVAELIGHITAEGAGIAVSPEMLETIDAVKLVTVNIANDDGATALSRSARSWAWIGRRRCGAAGCRQEKGFVANLEQHRGRPGKYRLTEQEIEAESLLPTVDQIRAAEEIEAFQSSSSAMGRKSTQPCNHSQFDEEDQGDSGCNGCATASNRCKGLRLGCSRLRRGCAGLCND